jgi:arabinofuranosyltransferase
MLCRQDLVLIGAPIVFSRLRLLPWRARYVALVAGALPLVGWEVFSLIYYGVFVPNTALAKLGAGLDRGTLLVSGARYVAALGIWDPVGALLLVCGLGVGLVTRGRAIALGLVAYALYVVWIGGDFMCGRFFAIPIVLAAHLLCGAPWPKRTAILVAFFPLFVFAGDGLSPAHWIEGGLHPPWVTWGICDERLFYTPQTGLFDKYRPRDLRFNLYAIHGQEIAKKGVATEVMIGMFGYYGGPGVHIIDVMALADPLLSRLPMTDPSKYRPGHLRRALPEGYEKTIYEGRNAIADRDLAQYYDAIQLVTRGPLFSAARWRTIFLLQVGALDPLRDAYLTRRQH